MQTQMGRQTDRQTRLGTTCTYIGMHSCAQEQRGLILMLGIVKENLHRHGISLIIHK